MSKEKIINYLDSAGIKQSYNGFLYLIALIERGSDCSQSLIKISELYHYVAEKYSTTPVSVERSIRYAIQGTKQTNKEFLLRAIYHFNLEIDPMQIGIQREGGISRKNLPMRSRRILEIQTYTVP